MRHTHVPTSSILLILGSVLCFTMLDTITKYMAERYSVPVLVWARYTVQFLAMLVWLGPGMRLGLFRTQRLPLQVVRGGVLLASSLFFVGALRSLPLATATALNYTTPVLVVLMANLVLGERMTPARIAFVVAGLAGMLLIVRPGSDVFRGASLLALLAALCYATYQIMTRVLYGESPRVLLFYPAVVGAAVMTALAPGLDWPAHLPWQHAALIVVGGLLGTLGHFLFILAFQHGPASALTPFTYMQLVWATLMGWVVYGYFPDGMTIAGMGVIGLSGLLITLHERRRAMARVPGPVTVQ
ncbi:MAG: DMT family transporter [Betaproteobacteria bacterium]|nr:DMT family transporter [Betaproteobacteria bacterium]MDE2208796.1 DMT family transporter [Betaproteobacteria bacterium]MDE2359018.1 DMT family transporter [Betaproteobacteria bacterium]